MYSTRQYEFKHWTDLTIVDLSFVESPFFAASYAERCLNHDMKVSEIVGNLSGSNFRSAFGAFPGRGTPYFRKWKEDFVRLVERGDILLVFKDGKKPFSPIARQEDEGVFPTNSDPVLAERLIARANPEPPPPPVLNGLLKDIPSLNGNLWWESVPAERRNYLPPPFKRSETPEIAQAEPDEATSLTEDEREEAYRDFWEAKKQGDASAILAMEEKLGDEFYHSLETGGGGPFGKYYAIPKERAELMLEGLRVIERGSPIDDVRAFDNKIRNIRKDLINASSDPIAARRSIEVISLEGLSERVALEDVGSFVTEIPPRLGELEEIYAGAITAVVGHPALMGLKPALKGENKEGSNTKAVYGAAASRKQDESLWKWNQNAKSPEDAVFLADEFGAFKDVVDDIRPSKLNPNVIEVITHDGLTARFAFLEDEAVNTIVAQGGVFDDVWAYYQPGKRFATAADADLIESGVFPVSPDKVMGVDDIFSNKTITVSVKKSLLKSDQGIACILSHEFHEVYGLYKKVTKNGILYRDLQLEIDGLHGQAVDIGDAIAKKKGY
ncbi:hypothetical protein HCH_03555 [Hahella chejuensis KCTC 2396]|uniref:Uncharacterized protein n=1 Tax=Hahella chejuensis (strain KCTC 2396) TaxID=349521 RepID=Q2SGC7_HAHCH|nr:hypothetical protein [Hahella chejuensis]ABC30297.1 hypothetical protein HCH_03555 [Hahella chejuensis KCTC 2396]